MTLENGVAIVTGGGRNIGEAVAHRFAKAGVNVAVVDLRIDAANAVASAINVRRPDSALAIAADVSSKRWLTVGVRSTS
jgi:3-oxoacyl-[acyl-carrier protein] reductase